MDAAREIDGASVGRVDDVRVWKRLPQHAIAPRGNVDRKPGLLRPLPLVDRPKIYWLID